jgi:hypothetical protein
MEPLRSGDPRRISSYEILNRLGAGGMGQVYLGRSPSGRRVAVKVIRPELTNDATFRQRFRREVIAMRQVSGFFTAPVVDADPDGDPAWLATAFVPGPSLESAVADGGAMPHQDVLLLAAGLAEALNAIHREGLTHRDLKPGNVLMADDGPRVIDFGLAVTAESAGAGLTQAGTVVGTPAFMSPEQVSGQQVGPASDIWSLGAVLAYAATGASPFGDGGTMETMLRVMNGEPDLSGLTGTLAQLASACMMKDPNARPTPARILQVLSEGAGVQPTMAMEVQPPSAADGADAGSGAAAADAADAGAAPSAEGVRAEPAWPTADAAAQAAQSTWGAAAASGPVSAPDHGAQAGPVSGAAAQAGPASGAAAQAGPASGAAQTGQPGPAPAWDTAQTTGPAASPVSGAAQSGSPASSSAPVAPTWGSGAVAGSAPHSNPGAPSQSSAPAWGSSTTPAAPSQPSAPAWGSGSAATSSQPSTPMQQSPSPSPSQSWGAPSAPSAPAPGPVSGPSTPPQPMPSMPSNPWPQSGQSPSPMYQSAPPTQAAHAAQASAGPWMQPQPSQPYGVPMLQPAPVKKNRNGLIAAVGVAAVVVIGGGIAIFASGGGSGGSSGGTTGGTTGGTLGGTGGIGKVTPIPATFPLSSLVTDADAAQYLRATPSAGAPSDDSTDDPTTFDKDWLVDSASTELRVQAWNYKSDSKQAITDFADHTSTLATDAKYEDQGSLGNSDKTEIQVASDPSSGLQHCKIEMLRGGLDVTVTFVESGSPASAHTDVVNLAKLIAGRLPAK